MAHPHKGHEMKLRHEKHHKLGVHGEHPEKKADRLACGGHDGMARGGRLPKAFIAHEKHKHHGRGK